MKPGMPAGAMPENVSVRPRAIVTAGLAKLVLDVNHHKLLDCLAACFTDVPELKKDAARARKLRKAGGCCPS